MQRVQVELVDDIDGTPATETVVFGLDGSTFEVDLNDKHAKKLRDALATFVEHGRKVTRNGTARKQRSTPTGPSAADVRAWAQANGVECPERGRVPSEVREAFEAAQAA